MNNLEIVLKRIPGVDYVTAVKRMSDNTAFYAELLRLFFNDDPPRRVIAAFEKKDYDKAQFEAHSLKGTAANLGLTDISQIASAVFLHLKNKDFLMAEALLEDLVKACCQVSDITKQLTGGTENE